jgi:hypothetical protein
MSEPAALEGTRLYRTGPADRAIEPVGAANEINDVARVADVQHSRQPVSNPQPHDRQNLALIHFAT